MPLAVPAQATVAPGSALTSALWNSNVRDAVNFLLNPPEFVGIQTVAQTLTNGNWTALTFDTSTIDTYSGHSNITNNSRYTAQVNGRYDVYGFAAFNTNATGGRGVSIAKNGTRVQGSTVVVQSANGTLTAVYTYASVSLLASTDYVEIQGIQLSGGNLATLTASDATSSMTVIMRSQ